MDQRSVSTALTCSLTLCMLHTMHVQALRDNLFLKQLVLDFNPIGDEGAIALCEGLSQHSGVGCLQILSLEDCGIGAAGVEASAPSLCAV